MHIISIKGKKENKIYKSYWKAKYTVWETEQASEAELDMARMLGLSNHEFFKKSMINMLRDLMDNIDNIQE